MWRQCRPSASRSASLRRPSAKTRKKDQAVASRRRIGEASRCGAGELVGGESQQAGGHPRDADQREPHRVIHREEQPDRVEYQRTVVRALLHIASTDQVREAPCQRCEREDDEHRDQRNRPRRQPTGNFGEPNAEVPAAARHQRQAEHDEAGSDDGHEREDERTDGAQPRIEKEQQQQRRRAVDEQPDAQQAWRREAVAQLEQVGAEQSGVAGLQHGRQHVEQQRDDVAADRECPQPSPARCRDAETEHRGPTRDPDDRGKPRQGAQPREGQHFGQRRDAGERQTGASHARSGQPRRAQSAAKRGRLPARTGARRIDARRREGRRCIRSRVLFAAGCGTGGQRRTCGGRHREPHPAAV